jgi:GT2 family glycosyltransferase
MRTAPISVGIPTFARGERVLETLAKIFNCDPVPAEILIHIDAPDGLLEKQLKNQPSNVRILSSSARVGPGGGRHRCIYASTQPFFVSFDDDSWPFDKDFFAEVVRLFERNPEVAVLAAIIFHPGEPEPARGVLALDTSSFAGCGYAMRIAAYRQIQGNVDRPWAYGLEEVDVSLQLDALGWRILLCESLRAFHDTQRSHYKKPEIVAAAIQNVALLAYLRYPIRLWPRALLQVGNKVAFSLRQGSCRGVIFGVLGIPYTLFSYASQRRALSVASVLSYLKKRQKLLKK